MRGRASWPLSIRILRRLGGAGGGQASGALRVWLWWESLLVPRSRAIRQGSVLRYALVRHRGRQVRLREGDIVKPGDRLLELHFDNRTLLQLASSPEFDPFGTERSAVADLRLLAGAVKAGELAEVIAVHALTPFPAVLRRQGFEVTEVPHTFANFFVRFHMTGLLAVYHPKGWAGLSPERARRWPAEAWLGRDAFVSRFAPAA